METYENKIAIESCVKTMHKQQCTEHKAQTMIDELEMAYDKAKAFDEVIKKVKTEFISQDLADVIRTLVYDYEYDKEDY